MIKNYKSANSQKPTKKLKQANLSFIRSGLQQVPKEHSPDQKTQALKKQAKLNVKSQNKTNIIHRDEVRHAFQLIKSLNTSALNQAQTQILQTDGTGGSSFLANSGSKNTSGQKGLAAKHNSRRQNQSLNLNENQNILSQTQGPIKGLAEVRQQVEGVRYLQNKQVRKITGPSDFSNTLKAPLTIKNYNQQANLNQTQNTQATIKMIKKQLNSSQQMEKGSLIQTINSGGVSLQKNRKASLQNQKKAVPSLDMKKVAQKQTEKNLKQVKSNALSIRESKETQKKQQQNQEITEVQLYKQLMSKVKQTKQANKILAQLQQANKTNYQTENKLQNYKKAAQASKQLKADPYPASTSNKTRKSFILDPSDKQQLAAQIPSSHIKKNMQQSSSRETSKKVNKSFKSEANQTKISKQYFDSTMRPTASNGLGNTVININIENSNCGHSGQRNLNKTTKIKRADSISSDLSNNAAKAMINSMVQASQDSQSSKQGPGTRKKKTQQQKNSSQLPDATMVLLNEIFQKQNIQLPQGQEQKQVQKHHQKASASCSVKQTPRDKSGNQRREKSGNQAGRLHNQYQKNVPKNKFSEKASLNSTQQFTKKSLKTNGSLNSSAVHQSNSKKNQKVGKNLKFQQIIQDNDMDPQQFCDLPPFEVGIVPELDQKMKTQKIQDLLKKEEESHQDHPSGVQFQSQGQMFQPGHQKNASATITLQSNQHKKQNQHQEKKKQLQIQVNMDKNQFMPSEFSEVQEEPEIRVAQDSVRQQKKVLKENFANTQPLNLKYNMQDEEEVKEEEEEEEHKNKSPNTIKKMTNRSQESQKRQPKLKSNRGQKAQVPQQNPTSLSPRIKNIKENTGLLAQQLNQRDRLALQKREEDFSMPCTAAKALKHFMKELTDYEKGEILDFKQIYFIGKRKEAKKIKGNPLYPYNFGYDDDQGDYKVVLNDHIGYRYEVQSFLGKGSFGQAIKCYDHKTGQTVALKIIRNKKKFQHQAQVELHILQHLKDHDPDDQHNIIRIKDSLFFRKHLVISFELFSINLYEFIQNNDFKGVSLSLIRRFAIQILQALKYLKEQKIIHCDLKPENILLKSADKSGIKIIDFGSSCFTNSRIYTYIQSRFYRAPEIILGIPYTPGIDMWSFGCILVELFTGRALFPGESEAEQLQLIMEVRGKPGRKVLMLSSRRQFFFDEQTFQPLMIPNSQDEVRIPGSIPLEEILEDCPESFVDFVDKCLQWDPDKRIKPLEALMHPWVIEGLPPQVLLHHRRMIGLDQTPDLEEQERNSSHVASSTISPRRIQEQEQMQSVEEEENKQKFNSTQPILQLPPAYHAKADSLMVPDLVQNQKAPKHQAAISSSHILSEQDKLKTMNMTGILGNLREEPKQNVLFQPVSNAKKNSLKDQKQHAFLSHSKFYLSNLPDNIQQEDLEEASEALQEERQQAKGKKSIPFSFLMQQQFKKGNQKRRSTEEEDSEAETVYEKRKKLHVSNIV